MFGVFAIWDVAEWAADNITAVELRGSKFGRNSLNFRGNL